MTKQLSRRKSTINSCHTSQQISRWDMEDITERSEAKKSKDTYNCMKMRCQRNVVYSCPLGVHVPDLWVQTMPD